MSNGAGKPIKLSDVIVKDAFWKHEMELVRKEVLPYQWDILNDRVADAAPSYCMRNFKMAGNMNEKRKAQGISFQEPKYTFRGFEAVPDDPEHLGDQFYGFVFQDSDFSKWIEAVAYSLEQHEDPELEAVADEAIDIVCAAQLENGYLDTYYILGGTDRIFTNLRDHHELYCFGHLAEGAVAYYHATGKDKLLRAACRFADYIDSRIGGDEGKIHGYPGHEIAEMALVRLYETTGEEKYLSLGKYFIDQRGQSPNFFTEIEQHEDETDLTYYQAHKPVREQDEAVGHAVRAMYLYAGMADYARLTEDAGLKKACQRLWDHVTKKKMYITGGVGATHVGEAFSYAYDLPSDMAYSETCAAIGLIFWARRMLQLEANREYADVMERALYNTVLAGIAIDGKSFFYTNPLEVDPAACHKDARLSFIKPVRQKWFGCACCPPNISRLISSLPSYAYTETEDTLFVHLYLGGVVRKKIQEDWAEFQIDSEYPRLRKHSPMPEREALSFAEKPAPSEKDSVRITYTGDVPVKMTLALRIPGFCDGYEVLAYGKETEIKNGYIYVSGIWRPGDEIDIVISVITKLLQADPRVRGDIGKAALMRGPVVYCLEEEDNGAGLYLSKVLPQLSERQCRIMIDQTEHQSWSAQEMAHEKVNIDIGGLELMALKVKGKKEIYPETEASEEGLSDQNTAAGLYRPYQPVTEAGTELTFIPYFAWANRSENEMRVWVRV